MSINVGCDRTRVTYIEYSDPEALMWIRFVCTMCLSLSIECSAQDASRPDHPGGKEGEFPSKCTRAVPKFTDRARAVFQRPSFIEATAVIQVEILPPGRIGAVSIRTSSGYPEFDEMALQAYADVTCSFPQPLEKQITGLQTFTFRKN
jgi:TonB family protein